MDKLTQEMLLGAAAGTVAGLVLAAAAWPSDVIAPPSAPTPPGTTPAPVPVPGTPGTTPVPAPGPTTQGGRQLPVSPAGHRYLLYIESTSRTRYPYPTVEEAQRAVNSIYLQLAYRSIGQWSGPVQVHEIDWRLFQGPKWSVSAAIDFAADAPDNALAVTLERFSNVIPFRFSYLDWAPATSRLIA